MAVYVQRKTIKHPDGSTTAREDWYVDLTWIDPATKQKQRIRRPAKDEKQRPARSRTAAEQCENRIRAELAAGTFEREAAPQSIKFKDFEEQFFRDHVAKLKPTSVYTNRTAWRIWLAPDLSDIYLQDIDANHFVKLATKMRAEKCAGKTINNTLSILRTILAKAHEWGLRGPAPEPAWERAPEAEIDFFDEADIEKLVSVGDPMSVFAIKTGLRLGELLALTWRDVDLVKKQVTVSKSVWTYSGQRLLDSTKSGKVRVIPLPESAVTVLQKLGEQSPDDLVFRKEDGKPQTHGSSRNHLYRVCDKANLPRCGWHKLRHSYVSSLVAKNVPLPTIQKLAGHSRIEMTLRYSHVNDKQLRAAVSVLD